MKLNAVILGPFDLEPVEPGLGKNESPGRKPNRDTEAIARRKPIATADPDVSGFRRSEWKRPREENASVGEKGLGGAMAELGRLGKGRK